LPEIIKTANFYPYTGHQSSTHWKISEQL